MSDVIFKFSYGLFVLTAKDGNKDNGCIINTAMQATATPFQVVIMVSKQNYTHDMIVKTKKFNLSFLSEEVTFDTFKQFGFQCGRDVDKFAGYDKVERSANGIYYITEGTNAMVSVDVLKTMDIGTHTVFIGEVTEDKVLSDNVPSCTYDYYQNSVKPKPASTSAQKPSEDPAKRRWVCTICSYVYDPAVGDPDNGIEPGTPFEQLPEDWVCPLCKHGKEVFKPEGEE